MKRCDAAGVTLNDLFIGSIITFYSRQLKIADYADVYTRQAFAQKRQKTFALIKPDVYPQTGKIIDAIYQNGFVISRLKMSRFNNNSVGGFYQEHQGKPFFQNLCNFMTSDVSTGIELVAANSVDMWRKFIGPTDSS